MKNKEPLHKKISDDILSKIINNEYKIGEVIPREIDLADDYQVSRTTIRKAIETLVAEGYLTRIKRKGTIVKQKKINQGFIHVLRSFDEEIMEKGQIPATEVLEFNVVDADEDVATYLDINVSEKVYYLVRLRYANDEPIVLVKTFIPMKEYPHLKEVNFTKNSLYDTFAKYNKPISSVKRRLNIEKANKKLSDILNITKNDPVYNFYSLGRSIENIPIEYSISWCRGDLNSFEIEIK